MSSVAVSSETPRQERRHCQDLPKELLVRRTPERTASTDAGLSATCSTHLLPMDKESMAQSSQALRLSPAEGPHSLLAVENDTVSFLVYSPRGITAVAMCLLKKPIATRRAPAQVRRALGEGSD